MAQTDMAVNSGLEKPWETWGQHWVDLCEPLVIDRHAIDAWGTSAEAQRGMEALMALMPDAGYAPTDAPADAGGSGV